MFSAPNIFLQLLAWAVFLIHVYLFVFESDILSMLYQNVATIIGYIVSVPFVIVFDIIIYTLIGIVIALIRKHPTHPLQNPVRTIIAGSHRLYAPTPATQQQKLVTNVQVIDAPEDKEFWIDGILKADGNTLGHNPLNTYVLSTLPNMPGGVPKFCRHYYNIRNVIWSPRVTKKLTVVQRLHEKHSLFPKWSPPTFYYSCDRAAVLARGNYDVAFCQLSETYAQTTE
ncbi:hypothetical protein H4R20_005278 [Coemansia guatemalensis]|uniref:Uncharacterized protein n=1 Tax=Coemansia guatemalensis TaxID=2761395 RepID=A0A9W8HX21_9FUNG|nr:hypothetical protein H4R20_005278 [Coemansia guatemalensis]